MKLSKVIFLGVLSIFAVVSLSYAYSAMINVDQPQAAANPAATAKVEGAVDGSQRAVDAKAAPQGNEDVKGSPFHAGGDIAAWLQNEANIAGKTKKMTIDGKEVEVVSFSMSDFAEKIRTKKRDGSAWSDWTLRVELTSLVNIGILGIDNEGNYVVFRGFTRDMNNSINVKAIEQNIVDKKRYGKTLGTNAHRLDDEWLGSGDRAIGAEKSSKLRGLAREAIGVDMTKAGERQSAEGGINNAIAQAAALSAEIVAAEHMSVTITGEDVASKTGVVQANNELAAQNLKVNTEALVENLAGIGVITQEANIEGAATARTANFNETRVRAMLYKEDLAIEGKFAVEFEKIKDAGDIVAVIVAINNDMEIIAQALQKAGLSQYVDNQKIIIMGVEKDSPAAMAFGRLFGDKNTLDLQNAANILNNKDAVIGIAGAV